MSQKKSGLTTLLLCVFLGFLGIHRFYVGKVNSGIVMLLTLGGFGIWWMVDLVMIVCNEFTDADGHVIPFTRKGDSNKKYVAGMAAMCLPPFVMMAIAIAGVLLFMTDGMSATVKDQLAAIRAGDYQQAYQYTSKGFRNDTSFSTFEQFIENYPVMKNNSGITISETLIEEDDGYIAGVIHSKSGRELPIEYQLVNESGVWKIVGFRVSPPESEDSEEAVTDDSADEASVDDETADGKQLKNLTYSSSIGKYSIEYPSTWYFETPDDHSVLFSGKRGSPAYISTVTIQTLPMKKVGGIYANAKEVVKDLRQQIKEQATDVKMLREGDAELPTDPKHYTGRFFEITYTYKNVHMKKMQFIIVNPDSTQAYSWGYTTEASRYDKDLPVAQAMYESWKMNVTKEEKPSEE